MKTNGFIIIFLMLYSMIFGQDVNVNNPEKTPAIFMGVKNTVSLNKDNTDFAENYFVDNLDYPGKAIECHKEGTEVVKFIVTNSGMLTNIKVVNSVCKEIDAEVIRILKESSGMWRPAYQNGVPVESEHVFSMVFCDKNKTEINDYFVARAETFYKAGNRKLFKQNRPKKAIKFYNYGLRYLPYDKGLLLMRGISNYKIGNLASAQNDWKKVTELGGVDFNKYDLAEFERYPELTEILSEN